MMRGKPHDLLVDFIREEYLPDWLGELIREYSKKWGCDAYQGILRTRSLSPKNLADRIACLYGYERLFHVPQDLRLPSFQRELCLPYLQAKKYLCYPLFLTGHRWQFLVAQPLHKACLPARFFLTKALWLVGDENTILKAIEEGYPLEVQIPSLGPVNNLNNYDANL